jgi:hypothetical protein
MTRSIFGMVMRLGRRDVFAVALLVAMVVGLVLVAKPAKATHTRTCEIIDGTRICTPDIHENTAPIVNVDNTSMTVTEGKRVTNTGTYSDSQTGDIEIEVWVSAPGGIPERCGTVTKTGTNSGTWSWSSTPGEGGIGSLDPLRCNDDGPSPLLVTVVARDSDGAEGQVSFTMTVDNAAPGATLTEFGQHPWREGETRWFYQSYSLGNPLDPSHADRAAGFQVAYDCGYGYDAWRAGEWHPYWVFWESGGRVAGYDESGRVCDAAQDSGTREVSAKIKDKDGGVGERTEIVTIENVAPTATFGAPGSVDDGSSFALSLANPQDPSAVDRQSLRYAFDCGSGYGTLSGTNTTSCSSAGGSRTVRGKIIDKDGGETEYAREVAVNNVAPKVTGTTPANEATEVARGASLTATFSEPMKQSTLAQSTFKLFKVTSSGSTQVNDVTVSLSTDGLRATLDPFGMSSTLLTKNTTYRATITTGAHDVAGNALDQDPNSTGNQPMVWTFTTSRN